MKVLLVNLMIITILVSCMDHNSRNDSNIEEEETLADTAYLGSYHYVTNLDELGETYLHFTFSDIGMEGRAFSKDTKQEFRIDPVMHIGGFVNLKLIKSDFFPKDLTFYNYLFNFEYKYLKEPSIKTNFYSKNTKIRTDVIISKVKQ